MGLNYDKVQKHKRSQDITYGMVDRFPACKGFFPDCSDTPSLLDSKCRNCPMTNDLKKPRLSFVNCEYCKEEEMVPFDSNNSINEDTKCHNCDKINSKEWIKKQRAK